MDYDANHEKWEKYEREEAEAMEYDEELEYDDVDVYDDKHQTMKTYNYYKDETFDHFAEEGKL